MLPRTELTGTRPLTSVDAASPVTSAVDSRQALYSRLALIGIGKTLTGDVLSRLADGAFLLKIADTAVKVTLPANTRVGDQIPLKLVATEPRPTFLLTPSPNLQSSASAPASLSTAAQIIGAVLQTADADGTPPVIIGKTPIVSSPLAGPPQVAAALQDTLAVSGVFYESHLQQWAEGERTLTQLLREPQAQGTLAKDSSNSNASDVSAGDAGNATDTTSNGTRANKATESAKADTSKLIDIVTTWERDGRAAPSDRATADAKSGDAAKSGAAQTQAAAPDRLDAETAQRVNVQLNTLENNRVAWQGELWPGQKLEWAVSDDSPRGQGEPAGVSSWTSLVRFELPQLGVITASIHLDGDHVRMQVRATTDDATSRLRQHGHELASALDAAGSPLDLLTIKTDDQT